MQVLNDIFQFSNAKAEIKYLKVYFFDVYLHTKNKGVISV